MALVLLLLAFVVGVLLAVFGLQNNIPVSLNFLGYAVGPIPLSLVIFATALLGMALSALLWLRERLSHTLDLRRRDRRIRELEAEVYALRSGGVSTPSPAPLYTETDTTAPVDATPDAQPRPESYREP